MDNSYDKSKIFKFNLIPPKTKEEIVVLQERDNTILYSFILIFVGMFIYFVLTLIQALLISPRVTTGENLLKAREQEITSYDSVRRVKGELFVKAQSLEPILDRDIKLSGLLKVGDNIIKNIPQSSIISYSRELTGDFVIEFTFSKIENVSSLIKLMKDDPKIKNIFLRTLANNEAKSNVRVVISFTLLT